MTGAEIPTWRDRVLINQEDAGGGPPDWLRGAVDSYRQRVLNEHYPCYFGVNSERAGDTFYSYVSGDRLDMMVDALDGFIAILGTSPGRKHNLAVFFEPEPVELSHDAYRDRFWRALQYLEDCDRKRHGGTARRADPEHFLWEFSYRDELFFVVGAAPSYKKRHSRNLGPSLIVLFQPRRVFTDSAGYAISDRARREVRARLSAWDAVGPQPDLGIYGERGNREWKQYFLPDDPHPVTGRCPLAHGNRQPGCDRPTGHRPTNGAATDQRGIDRPTGHRPK